jgi:H+-transporting ATPase
MINAPLFVRNTSEYADLSVEETLKILQSSTEGLTGFDVQQRLQSFGLNKIAEKSASPLLAIISRYWGIMPWLLELAIVLSIILKHYLEAGIIFVLLTINAIIGHIQARSSQRSLDALKKRLAVQALVLRDGTWATVEAQNIVPGDIISLGLGDIVPADAKLIDGSLSIDQSILTGESLPIDLQQSAILYSSSIVSRGEARCAVVNTGLNTYFGKTAELVKIARPKSHQEQIMLTIVRYSMFLSMCALVIVAAYAIATGTSMIVILTIAVIFLMGAVPVALPAVMTIVQSVGAIELARTGVLVTRLNSIEDAASIDMLCLDKTGTLTQNKLSVGNVIPFNSYSEEDVISIACLASRENSKDAIDATILNYAKSGNPKWDSYTQTSFTPFEPSSKRTEATIVNVDKQFRVTKGAPQIVISLCKTIDEASRTKADQTVGELSQKGYRIIAVAISPDDSANDMQLAGLISLADPPRPDSQDMIERAKELGIKPIMLTGDNIAIAKEIARQVTVGSRIIRMEDFRNLNKAEQIKIIEESDGFAEIYPEDKYMLVKLLQALGHMVGMTGDGVNDAPALKQAEMGIAVNSATDVAKASASMVLTEPGMGVIIDAIKTSRHVYQRMLTWVINKVTKVIQVIGVLTIGFFWFHDLVVSLIGMALLIFANDFVTMSIATDNVKYTASPNKWNVRNITFASLIVGALLVVEGAAALFIGSHYFHLQMEQMGTFTVLVLIFTSQFRVYIVRERNYFWSSRPGKELIFATTGAIITFALFGIFGPIIASITPYQVLFALGFSAAFTFAIDFPKYQAFKKFGL